MLLQAAGVFLRPWVMRPLLILWRLCALIPPRCTCPWYQWVIWDVSNLLPDGLGWWGHAITSTHCLSIYLCQQSLNEDGDIFVIFFPHLLCWNVIKRRFKTNPETNKTPTKQNISRKKKRNKQINKNPKQDQTKPHNCDIYEKITS